MNRKERQERKDSRKELNLGHYRLRWLTMRIHLEFVRIPGLNQQLFRHTQLGEQSITRSRVFLGSKLFYS